ncbi:MAG: GspE/PulE family protein [Candidatus Sumerlaeia bacterium]|nr:GspE/PulE family protein [Candidatus Sumerlaeia bacterium]
MGLFSRSPKKPDTPKVSPDEDSKPIDPMNDLAAPLPSKTVPRLGNTPVPPGRSSANVPVGEAAMGLSGPRKQIVPSREQAAAFHQNLGKGKKNALANVLAGTGVIPEGEIDRLLQRHGESATTLKRALATEGLMKEVDFLDAMADSLGMDRVELNSVVITKDLLERVPKRYAKQYKVFPVDFNAPLNELKLAIADPLNLSAIDDLSKILNCNVRMLVAAEDDIERYFRRYYEADPIAQSYIDATDALNEREGGDIDQYTTVDIGDGDDEQPAVVKFVDLMFRQAIHERASDIHIEPNRRAVTIRFRVDGVLHELPSPPKKWQNAIISRLKALSGMDLAEKRVPQDGRIKLNLPDRKLDLRVSSLPSIYGESIVMRILDQSNVMLGLEDVGFLPSNVALFRQLIASPNGIIVMTGPTGSGKTTTLYSALGTLNNPETKIITIENPVEYMIEGINQVQVSEDTGLTFSTGLRSMLRQSPDVILVGEIRDKETAEIAIRAALTGHLVFSTLHTNDAPSAPSRLVDMGVKPFLVASALQAVIAQRLVRRLCAQCKSPWPMNEDRLVEIGATPEELQKIRAQEVRLLGPVGCDRCEGKGFRGRTAIHEVFVMDSRLRSLIIKGEAASRLKRIAAKGGMRTLRMDGWEKCKLGTTSVDEVLRITQQD